MLCTTIALVATWTTGVERQQFRCPHDLRKPAFALILQEEMSEDLLASHDFVNFDDVCHIAEDVERGVFNSPLKRKIIDMGDEVLDDGAVAFVQFEGHNRRGPKVLYQVWAAEKPGLFFGKLTAALEYGTV